MKTLSRRTLVAALAATPATLVLGCNSKTERPEPKGERPTMSPVAAEAEPADEPVQTLQPAEPVDPSFAGCARSCGAKGDFATADVVVQPTASVGDLAYCPVSGAVFAVTGASPRCFVGDAGLYFCCATCAKYFSKHEDGVLARRGIEGLAEG